MVISTDLGPTLEAFVAELVDNGKYTSRAEVLREGVRVIQEREVRLGALDAAIARGVMDMDSGRTKVLTDVFDRLDAKYTAIAAKLG